MSLSLSAKRTITLIIMDILIVAELTYTFSKCFSTKADFSETFLNSYVPLFVPTMVVALFILWRIKRREKAALLAMEPDRAALES
jgi:hypothetical protein